MNAKLPLFSWTRTVSTNMKAFGTLVLVFGILLLLSALALIYPDDMASVFGRTHEHD